MLRIPRKPVGGESFHTVTRTLTAPRIVPQSCRHTKRVSDQAPTNTHRVRNTSINHSANQAWFRLIIDRLGHVQTESTRMHRPDAILPASLSSGSNGVVRYSQIQRICDRVSRVHVAVSRDQLYTYRALHRAGLSWHLGYSVIRDLRIGLPLPPNRASP